MKFMLGNNLCNFILTLCIHFFMMKSFLPPGSRSLNNNSTNLRHAKLLYFIAPTANMSCVYISIPGGNDSHVETKGQMETKFQNMWLHFGASNEKLHLILRV